MGTYVVPWKEEIWKKVKKSWQRRRKNIVELFSKYKESKMELSHLCNSLGLEVDPWAVDCGDLKLMFVLFSIQNQKSTDPFTLSSTLFSLCRVSSVGDKILPTLFDFVFMNMTHGAVPNSNRLKHGLVYIHHLWFVVITVLAICPPSISYYYKVLFLMSYFSLTFLS